MHSKHAGLTVTEALTIVLPFVDIHGPHVDGREATRLTQERRVHAVAVQMVAESTRSGEHLGAFGTLEKGNLCMWTDKETRKRGLPGRNRGYCCLGKDMQVPPGNVQEPSFSWK